MTIKMADSIKNKINDIQDTAIKIASLISQN